ncbi:MAG: Cob(I)yrinic acid a,c-diamide adenosyltransferase [Syntrophorhabdaceae bacterium PtaU1.Bin034]|nr:MAG: Cob(I)yrinic acid a,c-diamide adenosyltransferase [Syntrophorhabdaceae bacterium PtaU1.Bin034]
MAKKGLLMVHTGKGKGKTTAALGLAFRALGHDLPVCIIQFIKGNWKYGELKSAAQFAGLLDFHVVGEGFTWKSKDLDKDRQAAMDGWNLAKSAIASGRYHLVILDEFTYAINYKMVDEDEAMEALRNRPEGLHVLVTGRDAPKTLIETADLVTEMREIKHPYKSGVKAQKGIEW